MSGRRLQVAVDERLLALGHRTGHARVWTSVLRELGSMVDLRAYSSHGRVPRRLRADVALGDGHSEPPRSSVPLVVQVHEAGWDEPATRDTLDPRFGAYIGRVTAIAVGAATAVITPSQSARRQVLDRYGLASDAVVAVHHGVDPQVFRPNGAEDGRRMVRNVLGSPRPYVLFAASVHPRKNLPVVREAVARLATDFPVALAMVLAPAPDRPDSADLMAAASDELRGAPGRAAVIAATEDTQLASLMAGCEAFCLPSASEGFGLTVVEAMSCGSAVVAADRGALPEVVGRAGVLVEPTADSVTAALRSLVGDPAHRERLRMLARERARGMTWSATAAGWRDVLEQAAS